jgi:PIN domain nuclease of toxin-antitoxin system
VERGNDEGMGRGLERPLKTYLDTHVVLFLATPLLERISVRAQAHMDRAELLISPVVLLELEYLFDVGKIQVRARDIQRKIEFELGVRVCDFSFEKIASVALDEKWTRDAFDRLIVSHAKANGLAPLVSSDRRIRTHYLRAIW